MELDLIVVACAAFIVSALLTGMVRRFALSRGLLDVPNARSSHVKVTPRGGGLGLVFATTAGLLVLTGLGRVQWPLALALAVGGAAVAAIGFMDDRRPVPARIRILVHLAAAGWAVFWIGAPTKLLIGHQVIDMGWGGIIVAVLGIIWTLNLFNFMDGIDGIAASEAVFVAGAASLLVFADRGPGDLPAVGIVLAASCTGFLVWNWPPAKIFMGDVGSGYLGYVIAVLALLGTLRDPIGLWIWLVLGGVFFIDATVTLIRRIVRGDRVYEAHRSHAYQWLSRRWKSHKSVTILVMAVNLLWLLPCAVVVTRNPTLAVWIAAVALTPVTVLAIVAGAGRRESI